MDDYPVSGGSMYPLGSDEKPRVQIDITKASMAKDIELGETVTIVIKGKVRGMKGPEQYMSIDYKNGKEKEVEKKRPGCIELDLVSMKVDSEGEFDGMLES